MTHGIVPWHDDESARDAGRACEECGAAPSEKCVPDCSRNSIKLKMRRTRWLLDRVAKF